MTTPITKWRDDSALDGVVWANDLDDRYLVEVQRIDDNSAKLVIFDHNDNDKVLLEEVVGLSYGAIFGPDVDDVATWQDRVVEFIDGRAETQP